MDEIIKPAETPDNDAAAATPPVSNASPETTPVAETTGAPETEAPEAAAPPARTPRPRRPRKRKTDPVEPTAEEPAPEPADVLTPAEAVAVSAEPAPETVVPAAESIPETVATPDAPAPDAVGHTEVEAEAAPVPAAAEPEIVAAEPEAPTAAEPAPEPSVFTHGEAEALLASVSGAGPESGFLDRGEQEVVDAGEPIPLLRRDTSWLTRNPLGLDVVVPEASEEEPLSPFMDFTSEAPADPFGLPEITPELLAEIRRQAAEEAAAAPPPPAPEPHPLEDAPVRYRMRDAGQPQGSQRPPREPREPREPRQPRQAPAEAPAPVPVAAAPVIYEEVGGLVVVPEALLEVVPDDWADELQVAGIPLQDGTQDGQGGGRRKRRRGRDRGGRSTEETPAAARPAPVAAAPATLAPPPAQTGPIILAPVPQMDEDGGSRDRRDRDRDREPKVEREYKELIVNVDERETRIAVLENGRLVELHVEREERVVGGIYKGRVSNVLPGMDAAFVDIGLERNAFLYVGDILFDDPKDRNREGDSPARRTSRDVRITDLAKPGQEILVQVVKGPHGTKGARVSTKISIPGRYLVLMPEGDHLGVSRKIEDARERERLRKIAESVQPKGFGVIVRTEAEGRTEQELKQDLEYLVRSWQGVGEKTRRAHAPYVVHKDLGIILKTIRDLFGQDTDKLVIDDPEEFEKIVDTLTQLAPELVDRVLLYDDSEPIFSRYHLEEEIEKLLRRKIWLRNGAYLLLDTTEALTTIDVNTGKFVGTSSLAETILKTNLDAVDEIARQLRLRDVGGMIVLDFIDMASSRDRALVMRALENAFKKDRTRIKIAHISPLGLVEMTRKRTSETVTDVMSHTCPYCQGRGRVWSPETMAIQIEREIKRLCAKTDVDAILVTASPEVAAWMVGPEGESIEQLERMLRRPVYVRARQDYHIEKFEIVPGDMMEMERQMMPFHGGQVVDCLVSKLDLITPPRSAAWADGYFVDLANGVKFQGQVTRVRLTDVRRSFALGEPVAPSTAVDRSEPI